MDEKRINELYSLISQTLFFADVDCKYLDELLSLVEKKDK